MKPKDLTAKKQQYQHIYQDKRWKRLRSAKIADKPICERCELEGRVTPATEVHHKIPFQKGRNAEEVEKLAFDWDNLMSVCTGCHKELDKMIRRGKSAFFLFYWVFLVVATSCRLAFPFPFFKI
ncbi:MAG: HNH endonuclease [Bacteroidales bacterium]|nr:HNH endonuclease [Bacteroidales bacterium]